MIENNNNSSEEKFCLRCNKMLTTVESGFRISIFKKFMSQTINFQGVFCRECLGKAASKAAKQVNVQVENLNGSFDFIDLMKSDAHFYSLTVKYLDDTGMIDNLIQQQMQATSDSALNDMTNRLGALEAENAFSEGFGDQGADPGKGKKIITPREIVAELDKTVIGQDHAKRTLAISLFKHQCNEQVDLKKNNLMIVGPTGSGKTMMTEKIAKMLDVPFVKVDASCLTPAGFKGTGFYDLVLRIFEAAGNDKKKAEKSIVFIDELDKLTTYQKDSFYTRVQHELLQFTEGGEFTAERGPGMGSLTLDTTNILFIFAGAFGNLKNIVLKNSKKSIGLNQDGDINEAADEKFYHKVERIHLEEYGIARELLGRISSLTYTQGLTDEIMKDILTLSGDTPLNDIKSLGELYKKTISFSDDWLNHVVHQAQAIGLGARSLKQVIDHELSDIYFNLPDLNEENIFIDKDATGTVIRHEFITPNAEV